ncbi:MAG: hypothetical protein B0D92_06375 [Spirochaeta sp. LUC14_002_19_P3]|nr:MAG: hypothetical protein B0D92_06375 [Spirochaeta sp. LUC14_002_19_P3]
MLILSAAGFRLAALTHVVGDSDTLFSLSRRYNVSSALIKRVNGLADDVIRKGERLSIPAEGNAEISVQPGDTLSGLAHLFGVSQRDIMAANGLDSPEIGIGKVLKIPPAVPEGTHRVLPGETILSIAARYGLSAAQLRGYNSLENDTIHPNQLLAVKPNRPEGYKVGSGDTLWNIARTYGLSTDNLSRWNNLGENKSIHPGDVLKLYPDIAKPATIVSGSTEPKTAPQKTAPQIALAAAKPPSVIIPDIPGEGEYFYSIPKKASQPNVKYWEGPTVSAAADYRRAQKVLEVFQAENDKIPELDRSMYGWHIVLDPGHGGLDPGAIVSAVDGNGNTIIVTEDEYVYDIALRLYRILVKRGASVDLTINAPDHHIRDGENARATFVNRKNEVYASASHNNGAGWRPVGNADGLDLRKTIAANSIAKTAPARRAKGSLFISLHADNSSDLPAGTAILFDGESSTELEQSKAMASIVARQMGAGSFIRRQTLRVLRNNPADAAILVEVRNIHYPGNAWALRSMELREQDAQMLASGILDWMKH